MVQVNDSMYGFIGTDVVLHCNFANPLPSVKITQVTWQKATNGSKQNVAIYNPAMGVSVLAPYRDRVQFLRPSFTDGTIRLSRLELDDEGVYICEFATFPAGNRESQLNLTVMGELPPPSPRARACAGVWPPCVSGAQTLSSVGELPGLQAWYLQSLWPGCPQFLGVGGRASALDGAEGQYSGCSPTVGPLVGGRRRAEPQTLRERGLQEPLPGSWPASQKAWACLRGCRWWSRGRPCRVPGGVLGAER